MSIQKLDRSLAEEGQFGESSSSKGSAVGRALDILEAVAVADRPLSPAELCEQLDLPKATVHRLCSTLEKRGLIEPSSNGRGLLPGRSLTRIATGALASAPYYTERHAVLGALSTEIAETCNLSVPDGTHMIYFDRAETHWPLRVQLPVGSLVPLHCTAAGKMFLSSLPPARQRRILSSLVLEPLTANTTTDIDELLDELARTDKRGFALDNEEYIQGMVALAVPLKDASGRLFATLSCNPPCVRVSIAEVQKFLPALQRAATALESIGMPES